MLTAIEATINLFRPELQRRSHQVFTELVEDLGVPATLNTAMWQLQGVIDVSARLGQTYAHLPLMSRPAGIEVAADDLQAALADLKIDEQFGEAEAKAATLRIGALNGALEALLREALIVSDPAWVAAAKSIPAPATKGREEALLVEKGFSGPLLETLVKAGAARRHVERVAFIKAATVAACTAAGAENPAGVAALILHADAAGVGGHADIEGVGTARPAILSLICGSGRKQAQDGAAWSAAIARAAVELCPDLKGEVIYHPEVRGIGCYDPVRADWDEFYALEETEAAQLIGPRYLRAAALRAALTPPAEGLLPQGAMISAAFQWADEALKDARAIAQARAVMGWSV